MPPVGFEPKISAGERPQTYALDRASTGTGCTAGIIRNKLHDSLKLPNLRPALCVLMQKAVLLDICHIGSEKVLHDFRLPPREVAANCTLLGYYHYYHYYHYSLCNQPEERSS